MATVARQAFGESSWPSLSASPEQELELLLGRLAGVAVIDGLVVADPELLEAARALTLEMEPVRGRSAVVRPAWPAPVAAVGGRARGH